MRRSIGVASILILALAALGATHAAAERTLGESLTQAVAMPADQAIRQASVNGKYRTLLAAIRAPGDLESYSPFNDYGRSRVTEWAGVKGLPEGYWVYVYPHWYIWEEQDANATDPGFLSISGRSWGPEQATGEPNTEGPGDLSTAWASATQDEQDEWLTLDYARPIIPVAVIVHETFNPGAISRVSLFRPDTEEVDAWKGTDPTATEKGHGVSIFPISTELETSKIKLYLDSKRVAGWNEIDAVGLIDQMGRTHWAVRAEASSTYATGEPPAVPAPITERRRVLKELGSIR